MEQSLYINLTQHHKTGCLILDEQHHGITATINSLYYFIQKGYGLEALKPTLKILNEYLMFHLKTEEMILEDQGLVLDDKEKRRLSDETKKFQRIAQEAIMHREPDLLLTFLKNWWCHHQKRHCDVWNVYLEKR